MYESFNLKTEDMGKVRLTGYHWHKEDASVCVCIIHGIGEYAGRYDRVAEKMRKAGYAVCSMDLRGHGLSSGKRGHCAPRTEIRNDIDALLSFARNEYAGSNLILYGHSMGGNLVLDYRKQGKLNHVPSGYVVSAPWVELVRPITACQYAVVKFLAKLMPSLTISSGVSAGDLGNPKNVGNYERDPLTHKKISLLCALEGFETGRAIAQGKMEDNGGAEGIPVLLMHGTEDRICSIQGSRKTAAIESCDYVEWPGLYHEIHNGGNESSGDEVIDEVVHWIQELLE